MTNKYTDYFDELNIVLKNTLVTKGCFDTSTLDSAFDNIRVLLSNRNNKIFFIGNGGSASIASHFAVDFSKNCQVTALALNDSSTLTCVANDYGYENVFSQQLLWYARANDVVVCISSKGESQNIRRACVTADTLHCSTITMTGFDENNPLRKLGEWNIYVPTSEYGFTEIAHSAILHSLLDWNMWEKER